jgi:hypothetical protein
MEATLPVGWEMKVWPFGPSSEGFKPPHAALAAPDEISARSSNNNSLRTRTRTASAENGKNRCTCIAS